MQQHLEPERMYEISHRQIREPSGGETDRASRKNEKANNVTKHLDPVSLCKEWMGKSVGRWAAATQEAHMQRRLPACKTNASSNIHGWMHEDV